MLAALVVLAFAGVGVVVARWAVLGGRTRATFPLNACLCLGLLGVGGAIPVAEHHALEGRLGRAATALTGRHAVVHCQSLGSAMVDMGSELGYVKWGADGRPEHATLIKRDQCNDLAAYLRSSKHHPTPAQVIAVHVLTHESMHMRGQLAEALAECEAVQRDARTAMLLGASERDAQLLARTYWITDYPRMPDGYTTGDCRPGGPLDEGLPDPPW